MGSGASVLCGGVPQLHFYCLDIRMVWSNGLVMFEDGSVQSIDHHGEDAVLANVEMVNDEEMVLVSENEDYDYDISDEDVIFNFRFEHN